MLRCGTSGHVSCASVVISLEIKDAMEQLEITEVDELKDRE
eukprot:COSAG05_NODE_164_length_15364_cov_46.329731_7_plen_41_part_00